MEIDIEHIKKTVADYYDVTVEDLSSRKRYANVLLARRIAMYFAYKIAIDKIGAEFGGRLYATVVRSYAKTREDCENSPDLKEVLDLLEKKINV